MPRMEENISNTAVLASHLDDLVREHPDFEVLCDSISSAYSFRYMPNGLVERQDPQVQTLLDHINEEIVAAVQREGFTFLATTNICASVAMRMSIVSHGTLEDVDSLFEAIARWGRKLKYELLIPRNTRLENGGTTMLKRITFFCYGSLSYLIFLGTFLYAIGFIGNFGVPTSLDGPRSGSLLVAFAIDVALLGLFAVQHSVMARKWFKDSWTRIIPKPLERSTYVLFSSLALALMFWLWQPLGGVVWSVEDPLGRFVLRTMFAFGWGLVLVSTFLINHFDLFGLRQAWLYLRQRPYTTLNFGTPGPYRLVRHPLYVGWLFAFWCTPTMTLAHLLFSIATTAYILIAIQLEERDLVREHGENYEAYRRSVPMLIPFTRRRSGSPGHFGDARVDQMNLHPEKQID